MKRLTMVFVICLALVPSSARADDGGWWDWFWSWDPKFMGASSEIHLLCLDREGNRIAGCEEAFRNIKNSVTGKPIVHCFRTSSDTVAETTGPCGNKRGTPKTWADIKHDIDFHFGYSHNYGDRYREPPDQTEGAVQAAVGSINVVKLMAMYYYRPSDWLAVGSGVGLLSIYGDGFDAFARGIFKTGVIVYPVKGWKAFGVRPEVNYITGGLKAADFGDPAFSFNKEHEWNLSISVGFDLRRTGVFQ